MGNPVGLFSNISSGVVDIFYEPYQGFVMSRPQDLGIGLARVIIYIFISSKILKYSEYNVNAVFFIREQRVSSKRLCMDLVIVFPRLQEVLEKVCIL